MPEYTKSAPSTAEQQRRAKRNPNRGVAALLIGVSLVFLAGAFGVGFLVVYGPY